MSNRNAKVLLEAVELLKKFDGRPVVNGLSFTVQ